nr:MAG TPA: hypothetical protein [Caudoviricetes sp.]
MFIQLCLNKQKSTRTILVLCRGMNLFQRLNLSGFHH